MSQAINNFCAEEINVPYRNNIRTVTIRETKLIFAVGEIVSNGQIKVDFIINKRNFVQVFINVC